MSLGVSCHWERREIETLHKEVGVIAHQPAVVVVSVLVGVVVVALCDFLVVDVAVSILVVVVLEVVVLAVVEVVCADVDTAPRSCSGGHTSHTYSYYWS